MFNVVIMRVLTLTEPRSLPCYFYLPLPNEGKAHNTTIILQGTGLSFMLL